MQAHLAEPLAIGHEAGKPLPVPRQPAAREDAGRAVLHPSGRRLPRIGDADAVGFRPGADGADDELSPLGMERGEDAAAEPRLVLIDGRATGSAKDQKKRGDNGRCGASHPGRPLAAMIAAWSAGSMLPPEITTPTVSPPRSSLPESAAASATAPPGSAVSFKTRAA